MEVLTNESFKRSKHKHRGTFYGFFYAIGKRNLVKNQNLAYNLTRHELLNLALIMILHGLLEIKCKIKRTALSCTAESDYMALIAQKLLEVHRKSKSL